MTRMPSHVVLTPEDEEELRQLSQELETEFLAEYEHFLYTRARRVDLTRWKELRHKDDAFVFRQREDASSRPRSSTSPTSGSASASASGSSTRWPEIVDPELTISPDGTSLDPTWDPDQSTHRAHDTSAMEIGPLQAMAATWPLPELLATGTAPGTLDDVMYGLSVRDTTSLRTRCVYRKEPIQDCAVLTALETPQTTANAEEEEEVEEEGEGERQGEGMEEADPYRFLGICWVALESVFLKSVVRPRDFVMLAHVRMTTTSRGERVGVVVHHPFTHRGIPDTLAPTMLRGRHSLCAVFRQYDANRIEFYITHGVDPGGHVPEMFVLQDMTQFLLAYLDVAEMGLKKKLHYLMKRRRTRNASASVAGEPAASTCSTCRKRVGRLFSGTPTVCQLCLQVTCSKCHVTKKLMLDPMATSEWLKPVDFCLPCMMAARKTPTLSIAKADVGT